MFGTDVETPSAPGDQLLGLLLQIAGAARRFLATAAAAEGIGERDLAALCRLVARGPLTGRMLGGELGVSPSSVSELADRLEQRNLATRQRGGEDRRAVELQATPEGIQLVQRAIEPLRPELQRVLLAGGERRSRDALRLLGEVNACLDAALASRTRR